MHLPEETVADLQTTREVFKVSSLDCEQDENSSTGSEMDKVSDDKYTTFQLPVEDKIVLEMGVNKLKLIEQKVIQEFYYTGLSQTEIAKKLGISCNYVSHILRNGTKKLRRILTTDEIREVQTQLQLASRRSDAAFADGRTGIIDGPTGIYTCTYLEDRLEEELLRISRENSEAAFAVVAIEGLDLVARRFGALHRDDALCSLAHIIKENVRRCDIVGRLSDDEFGVILLHTKQQCARICHRVRDAIQQAQFTVEGSQALVSFAAEVAYATWPADSTVGSELISIAREAIKCGAEDLKRAA
jgi:RNA polymerase sigma-B factor